MFPAPRGKPRRFVPENGGNKRPAPPSPDEYERLRRDANALREAPQSGRPVEQQVQGGVASYARYTSIGIQFLLSMLLPLGLGYWLDGVLGTSPWLVVTSAVMGAVAAMASVFYSFKRMEKRDARQEKERT